MQFSSLDEQTLRSLAEDHRVVVTLEDGQLEGGWGEKITAFYANMMPDCTMRVLNFGADKESPTARRSPRLNSRYGMTVESICSRIHGLLD